MTTRHYEVPPQLEDLLLEFTVNVLVNQPDNLVAYAVEYFTRLNESSNKYGGANNKLAPADTNNVQDGAASDQDDSMMSEDEGKSSPDAMSSWIPNLLGMLAQGPAQLWATLIGMQICIFLHFT